ncbi:hypothetical protein ACKFRT_03455 [Corynebacterium sp. YSMAA1_1_F7]|uniref:hypothetical protein n=1 Tax=Corynebacterium sp. YSMAA1_1_F7 TaxID=3383590 RepID=UPI0038D016F2
MARHASGKQNYRVAGWIWGALVALIVVVVLVVGWVVLARSNQDQLAEPECPQGDFVLQVWAADEAELQDAVRKFNAANEVELDHCLKAEAVRKPDAEAINGYKAWGEGGQPGAVLWKPADRQKADEALAVSKVEIAEEKNGVLAPQLRNRPLPELDQRARGAFMRGL